MILTKTEKNVAIKTMKQHEIICHNAGYWSLQTPELIHVVTGCEAY